MMMNDIEKILNTGKHLFIDKVYKHAVPDDEIKNNSHTIAVIQRVNRQTDCLGNNTFGAVTDKYEVQIYYSVDFNHDIEAVEESLMLLLVANGYTIDTMNNNFDKDTKQIYSTLYFYKSKIIKEESRD